MSTSGSVRTRWGLALVVVLAVVVVALALFALQRGSSGSGAPPASPATGVSSPPSSPSPSPSETSDAGAPAESLVPAAEERFLAAGAGGLLWRAVAGSCSEGVEPLLERSADGGESWSDVTPRYRGITQILGLDAFAGDQAEIVATLTADGDDCAVRVMQTFSDGEFWDESEDALADSTYAEPDLGAVVASGEEISAPCAEPRSVRFTGQQVAAVCDGAPVVWNGDGWDDLSLSGAVTLDGLDGTLYVAHTADDCAGLAVSTVAEEGDPQTLACHDDLDPSQPAALAPTGDGALVWSGDAVS